MALTKLGRYVVGLALVAPLDDYVLDLALTQVNGYPDHFWVGLD